MSDLSIGRRALHPSVSSQLSVDTYFDEALYQREQQTLFKQGPRYVGHALSAPNEGG